MNKFAVFSLSLVLACGVQASWYWPFDSDDDVSADEPRVSELMEPASLLIDEAADLASDGKTDEAVEKYRNALAELDRIETENPERAQKPEFATLRNKRAYVNAAIDSMLLSQVKANAKAVAVSDTTELEKKLAEERRQKNPDKASAKAEQTNAVPSKLSKPSTPSTPREQAMADIAKGDYAAAELLIKEMLAAKPNGAMALNLRASLEAKQGKLKEAEVTLYQAITSNPRNYFAYYNMANLMLQKDPPDKSAAKRYYETGRSVGGPANAQLEALIK